ncbi:rhamnulokinase family protein [Halalkalibacter sp. APA_J-10(15)]|uniref:rhamnulokinase n=1 Tax=Halalkalibacter sp. APA_J-10(15) TaxID=2933805 RepID=UPI001FF28587|nr:rhamnulokinase family protein [Halalkalibacter sp. APA_J-10(15)]MCK0470496.1 rhamnulokinase [Halalkalibacter sp. APA_J-10(15)]
MKGVWAFDIGASNGRLMLSRFDGERLFLEEEYRFVNEPISLMNHLYWDVLNIVREIKAAMLIGLKRNHMELASVGIDTWGVDFGLISKTGELLANPYCYRDPQNDQAMEQVLTRIPEKELFQLTGVTSSPINTLFQLYALSNSNPALIEQSESLLLTPNLLTYFLTGEKQNEYTISSTTQLLSVTDQDWSKGLLQEIGCSHEILAPVVKPCTTSGYTLPSINGELQMNRLKVVNVGGHDTASALAALPIEKEGSAFMSCGTWILIGVPVKKPVTSDEARKNGFTNEGTIDGGYRLQKNLMGMWFLQQCRTIWKRQGVEFNYAEEKKLMMEADPFRSFIDPDHHRFFNPEHMIAEIKRYCQETNQPIPHTPAEILRCILESLVLKYRFVMDQLERVIHKRFSTVHMGGGVIQNELFCQFVANATNREVIVGPVEASSIGNAIAQWIALGEIGNLQEARSIVKRSFDVKHYQPAVEEGWQTAYESFKTLIEVSEDD